MNLWHLKLKILNFFPSSFQCDSVLNIENGFWARIMQVKECKSFTYNFHWTKENKHTWSVCVVPIFLNFRSVHIQNSPTRFSYDVTAYYINTFHGNRWEYWAKYLEGKWSWLQWILHVLWLPKSYTSANRHVDSIQSNA